MPAQHFVQSSNVDLLGSIDHPETPAREDDIVHEHPATADQHEADNSSD